MGSFGFLDVTENDQIWFKNFLSHSRLSSHSHITEVTGLGLGYFYLFLRSIPFLLLQPTGNFHQRTYPFSISTSSNICSSVNIELDFILNMSAMNANMGSNGSSPYFYHPLFTQGTDHGPISLCGREAGHSYKPLYIGDGYAAASASLSSGIPSTAALGPVDWDDGSCGEDPCIGKLC